MVNSETQYRKYKHQCLDPDNLFGQPTHLSRKYPTGNDFSAPWREYARWDHPIPKRRTKNVPEKGKIIDAPHFKFVQL